MPAPPLRDGHGRAIGDLRISITDRCDLRCRYCMPAGGLPWLDQSDLLTYEEITRIARLLAPLGVRKIRLTGGEPLVRPDVPRLVRMLKAIPELDEIAITTNGTTLDRRAAALLAAGVDRFNVSLDALDRERFHALTRRDALPRVLRGLETLAGLTDVPIKVNAVAIKGVTEHEALAFADLAQRAPYEIRFIEFMPLDADHQWTTDQVLTGTELLAILHQHHDLIEEPRKRSATARTFRFADGKGRLGLIEPVSRPFCSDCNRIRLTADGKLRTCLFSLSETDLRTTLRDGSTDEQLLAQIRDAVWRKELKHHVNEPGFQQPARTMSAIGG